ncbi:MOSC domain-containing protein [Nocardioides plantarum]|uniref:MOSC domain-containing protein n=1 Tax=Nocardioides plantarum TaxID=29299 RepID=A0ABV5K5G9_9ACTN|nr:MOSC domain-containing protein [Nocardioides plantarum]
MPTVVAIHVAKATRLPMRAVERVDVEAGKGIVGDRYHGTRHRHVTLQSLDALAEAAVLHGSNVAPGLTRRNLTIDHGVVPREPGALVRVGPVLLQVVRVAAPCKLLDDTIGPGAQDALRHRGGSVLRVLEGGVVALGDVVDLGVPGTHDIVPEIGRGLRGRLP